MLLLFRLLSNLFGSRGGATEPAVSPAANGQLALLGHQVRFDLLTLMRNPRARFFTIVFPLLFLVIFSSVFGKGHTVVDGHHITLTRYYTPGIMAQAVMAAAYANLVIMVTTLRENGILKRRRATPVPAWMLIASQALATVVISIAMATIMLVVARLAYGIGYPVSSLVAIYLIVALGTLSLGCVAYAVAGLLKNADVAQPFVQISMLPLFFISGIYLPTDGMPKALRIIGEIFPPEHIANTLHLASVNTSFASSVSLVDVAVLVGWALAAVAFALRRFSWLPS
ncbi:MAG: ABC transporter permease [Solirubrobacterales bacterium]|nr:ABC transporter permease [Solirubrobacterales bacterium]